MAKNAAWSDDGSDEAPLQLGPKKKRDDSEMDITPMIDITFLLLIFFLVASKMDPSAQVTLPKASYGMPIPEKDAVVLIITPAGPDKINVLGGTGKEFSSDPEEQEREIAEYVEAGFNGKTPFSIPPKTQVLIKADPTIKQKEIARIGLAIVKSNVKVTSLSIGVLESAQ